MYAKIISGSLKGVDGYKISVEVDVARGLPTLDIVGLPDQSVKESKNRVIAAIRNSGFKVPAKKITVNLAPAHIKKEGPLFDVPIALGILVAQEEIRPDALKNYCCIGELALNGAVRPVKGVLSIALEMRRLGIRGIILPEANKDEAGVVRGLDAIPMRSLRDAVGFLNGEESIAPYAIAVESLFQENREIQLDIKDIKGQRFAKRAVEVACTGAHNMILIGPPGTGKTMIARRIPSLLPAMDFEEALETTKIHSAYGLIESGVSLLTERPFRSPHHTTSDVALVQ